MGRRRRAKAAGKRRPPADLSGLERGAGDKLAQGIGRVDHKPSTFELEPLLALPGLQLLVCAFARHPDHLADFALGYLDLVSRRGLGRRPVKMQQDLGKAIWQAEEDDVFDLLAGSAQARA